MAVFICLVFAMWARPFWMYLFVPLLLCARDCCFWLTYHPPECRLEFSIHLYIIIICYMNVVCALAVVCFSHTHTKLHTSSYISSQFMFPVLCFKLHVCIRYAFQSVCLLHAALPFLFDLGPYVDFVIHSTMTFDTDWAPVNTLIPINDRETRNSTISMAFFPFSFSGCSFVFS